jgi:hypothetical protein
MNFYHFHDHEGSCGVTSSGGTEIVILAILCFRVEVRKRGISKSNFVAPLTAHAAFDKAKFLLSHRVKQGEERSRPFLQQHITSERQFKKFNGIQLISDNDNKAFSFKSDKANCVPIKNQMHKVHRWSLDTIQGVLSSHLVVTDANSQH